MGTDSRPWFSKDVLTLLFKTEHYESKEKNHTDTLPIRPNITESKPKLNPGFTFWIYYGFTRVDPKLTQSKPKKDTESKPRSKEYSESRPYKCIWKKNNNTGLQAVRC